MSDALHVRLGWEHTHREFLAALIGLRRLRALGASAHLEQVREFGPSLGGREVIFLPFYYDDRDLAKYLHRPGVRGKWVVNLAYEQLHFRCGRGYLMPDGAFARGSMLHNAWGPRFRELLLEHGIPEERIRLTGHPRFDIYHHRELLLSREWLAATYGLDPGKRWILVPYNFNLSYITDRLRESLIQRGYALTQPFIDGVREARDAFTPLVRELADANPDAEIILRVHPAGYEAEAIYAGETRQRPNLHVIAHYDIANWIVQAGLVIVWNSTSSMEAMVAGVPVVSYEPAPFAERFDFDVNRILPTLRSADEVLALAGQAEVKGLRYEWGLFERWYQHRDGRNIERLMGIVQEAQADYGRHAIAGRGLPLKAYGQRAKAAAQEALHAFTGRGEAPKRHGPPPQGLAEALSGWSVAPLMDFLR